MYAALWNILPGPWWVRVLLLVALVTVVLAALVFWVFPLVDQLISSQEVTVTE